ncbi:CheR family methyltransferase [Paraglaciecola chathamensis]|uniref:CheR family methyltransferase n=1 Tax=Paraglaciecola chathamensis TaxID=368405 RepID=UPI00270C8FEB|nr:CheR family methyltransferase [Paraglaciecola chathamensis]MDO6558636.1 CheR family methyltransferase [Paraglaciecola chathamensis]MDO6838261.1 CheR family methyltransferase [Paraglaciecola chathamensis]
MASNIGGGAAKQEFAFSQSDFQQVKGILYKKTGIQLADSKDSMVYSRLARRLRALKLPNFTAYLQYLATHENEEQHFINALTTNLTSFFRESHHFPVLKRYLQEMPNSRRIWCAASSTGEEPYSIAMTVAETYGRFDVPIEIIASDIDSKVLQTARDGIYPIERIEGLSLEQKKRFFQKGTGINAGKVRVVPELAKMVSFTQLNLTAKEWQIPSPIDVIFCRNVMIYFDKETQIRILERMVSMMSKKGIYVAGHSENFSAAEHVVKLLGKTVYKPVKRSV